MKITPAKQQIIDDARRAGYQVKHSTGAVEIYKERRYKTRPNKVAGIIIYSDDTAYDLSIDLDLAIGIRSHARMRILLGI